MCLGIPGKVIEIYQVDAVRMGRVDFGGVIKEACLQFVPDIQVGCYTIVHVGFAISELDEIEAQKTLDMLRTMDLLSAEFTEMAADGQAAE